MTVMRAWQGIGMSTKDPTNWIAGYNWFSMKRSFRAGGATQEANMVAVGGSASR